VRQQAKGAIPGALPPQKPIEGPWLSEEGLLQCLSRFPSLAFDWADPLGGGSSHGRGSGSAAPSAVGVSRSCSREAAAALFRRLDTDGDGVVHAHDLRVWRRMLPLGRPADQLVAKLMAGATHLESRAVSSGTTPRAGQGRRQSSHHSGHFSGGGDELSLGLKQWSLYMALKDDPELAAELTIQVRAELRFLPSFREPPFRLPFLYFCAYARFIFSPDSSSESSSPFSFLFSDFPSFFLFSICHFI